MENFIKERFKSLIGNDNSIGIRDKYDVAVLVIALILNKHEFKLEGEETNDKVVPTNWNSNADSYTLDLINHLAPAKTFHFKCLRMGNLLLVNAMIKDKNDKIHTLDVEVLIVIFYFNILNNNNNSIDKLVKNTDYKDVENLLLNLKEFISIFEFSIINPLVPGLVRIPTNMQEQQQQPPQRGSNRYREGYNGGDQERRPQNNQRDFEYEDPLRVGDPQRGSNRYRGGYNGGDQDPDLYPPGFPVFGHNPPFYPGQTRGPGMFPGQGGQVGRDHPGFGNVHNPYGGGNNPYGTGLPGYEQRLPRGAVPPGARFDPFGPPTGGIPPSGRGRGMPDRDDFTPPGFDNDHYM
ncbi:hypothetical protein ACTFIZ_011437 [Dictyostelium cf. discoideum]